MSKFTENTIYMTPEQKADIERVSAKYQIEQGELVWWKAYSYSEEPCDKVAFDGYSHKHGLVYAHYYRLNSKGRKTGRRRACLPRRLEKLFGKIYR